MPLGVENSIFTLSDKPKSDNFNLPHINVVQGQIHFTFYSTNFSLNSFLNFQNYPRVMTLFIIISQIHLVIFCNFFANRKPPT